MQDGSKYGRVAAQAVHPKRVTEQYHVGSALFIVFIAEQPAQFRPGSDQIEKSARDHAGAGDRGFSNTRQRQVSRLKRGHVLKRMALLSPMLVVDPGHAETLRFLAGF